jgi:hypothetical protein
MLSFHGPFAAIRMPDAADKLRQFSVEEVFHHRPSIGRLIGEARGGKHPAANSTETRLKTPQLGDQCGREIDCPEDAHFVSVSAPRDRRRGVVDVLPPQLPNRTDPSTSGLGQYQREVEANPLESLGRSVRCASAPRLDRTTSRIKTFLARHGRARILLRSTFDSLQGILLKPARIARRVDAAYRGCPVEHCVEEHEVGLGGSSARGL